MIRPCSSQRHSVVPARAALRASIATIRRYASQCLKLSRQRRVSGGCSGPKNRSSVEDAHRAGTSLDQVGGRTKNFVSPFGCRGGSHKYTHLFWAMSLRYVLLCLPAGQVFVRMQPDTYSLLMHSSARVIDVLERSLRQIRQPQLPLLRINLPLLLLQSGHSNNGRRFGRPEPTRAKRGPRPIA